LEGIVHTAVQQITGGRGFFERYHSLPGHARTQTLNTLSPVGDDRAHMLGAAKGDGKLTFDKLTDVYHSGTKHEEDQPSHLVVHDTNICATRCTVEFGNPCQNFCPASVYEMEDAADVPGGKQLRINASNCVHCKTCDIMDPYQIITWVPPEGGGGPNYDGM
jgi:electron-transferring-flavoprotein dehydrogenase